MQCSYLDIYRKLGDKIYNDIIKPSDYIDSFDDIIKNYILIDYGPQIDETQLLNNTYIKPINKATFDLPKFLYKLQASYNFDSNSIIKQFEIDFKRSTYKINGLQNTDVNQVLEIINNKTNLIQINNFNIKLNDLLLLVSTQASFAYQYMLMASLFADPKNNLYISSSKSSYELIYLHNSIKIILRCDYYLHDIMTSTHKSKIVAETVIKIFTKCHDYCIPYGKVKWNITNI
jgi:hypothetical protein